MPRTIDSIVTSHRTARERIAARKPVWSHSVPLAALAEQMRAKIADGGDPEAAAVEACQAVVERLRATLPATWFAISHAAYDETLDDIIEALDGTSVAEFASGENGTAVDHLRSHLDALYDWGDRKRVWLGR